MAPHLVMRRPTVGLAIALLAVVACRPMASRPTPRSAPTPAVTGRVTISAPMTPRLMLRALADSLLEDRRFRSAHWGVLLVDPLAGDTLYSRNAGKLFMPASNQKLITGAVALARLGADFRYETRVLGSTSVRDGVLAGDLAVLGSGDPTFSDSLAGGDAMAPFRAFADSLAARGIREVAGRLLRAAPVFPDSTLGFGWAWDDLDYGYSAPVDALFFNEGVARVTIVGGATSGAPVKVRTAPANTVPALGPIAVTTIARDTTRVNGRAIVRSRVAWSSDVRGVRPLVSLSGQVIAGDSVTLEVALRHPSGAWLDAFAEALAARGIRVRGGVEPNGYADTAGMVTLAARQSPPLREILPRFEKPSQNQIGELLFKTLGRVETGSGTADSGRVVVERQLLAWGADSAGFAVRDGSGLSRHDYLAPEMIVRVLDTMRRHPEFQTFYDALPIAGVDGTIRTRMRGTPAQGNVHAKTGTLDKARALSGYVTTADGRLLLFSMLANNHVVSNAEVERVQDALLVWLASNPIGTSR
ncbi:MAG: hypothetical protein RLZZ63_1215 [Gemmatimonadota bacterium]